ncbi:MAG: hypothetical protein JNM00_07055 [Flavobacteriales bacterium]|nr:hypothetical protein [Flavobacteriales bacterium]
MKIFCATKLLILCFLVIEIRESRAQYIPLVQEGNTWFIQNFLAGPFDQLLICGFSYKLQGDTLFNELTYKKFYVRNFYGVQGMEYAVSDSELIGFAREDMGRVYFTSGSNDQELMYFDFNIVEGDTAHHWMRETECLLPPMSSAHSWGAEICDGVDVSSIFSELRLLWQFQSGIMIEGVGWDNGLFEESNMNVSGFYSTLVDFCTEENPCAEGPLGSHYEESAELTIFPNPNNGTWWVQNTGFGPKEVKLFSSTGQIVKQWVLMPGTNECPVRPDAGCYWLQWFNAAAGEYKMEQLLVH